MMRDMKRPEPDAEQVVADLRARAKEGRLTLGKDELLMIAAMMERLRNRCDEAYQVVGLLAHTPEMFHDPAVINALDLLSLPEAEGDILTPFVGWMPPPPKT
jgi:hypothetical protein